MIYPKNIEIMMVKFYNSLESEKEKLHYAALEAGKLGEHGVDYICNLFGCDKEAVKYRIEELNA